MRSLFTRWGLLVTGAVVCSGVSGEDATWQALKSESKLAYPVVAATQPDSIVDPLINWPLWYGVQQTGEINASFSCLGTFGFRDYNYIPEVPEWPLVSFESPPGSGTEYLWRGAIWIGGIVGYDTLVSVGTGGWSMGREFGPPGTVDGTARGSITRICSPADYAMRALFTDTLISGMEYSYDSSACRTHQPLDIRIVNRSYAWRTSPANNSILYDLVITHIGEQPITSGRIGLYFDCDIGPNAVWSSYQDDLVGSIRDHGIAYMIDNDGDPVGTELPDTISSRRAFGVTLLASSISLMDTCLNWWRNWGEPRYDFGPRMKGTDLYPFREFYSVGLGTPMGDADKYYVMSKPEWDYDQILTKSITSVDPVWLRPNPAVAYDIYDGAETKFVLSFGPFDLMPDSSIRVIFATFSPDSVICRPDMQSIIKIMPEFYAQTLNLDKLIEMSEVSDSLADILLDPANPVTRLWVDYSDADSLVIEWDPWVFNTVDGYEISVQAIPPDALPYPGVLPPWYRPSGEGTKLTSGPAPRYCFDMLENPQLYCINVANRSGVAVGDMGDPLLAVSGDRKDGPRVPDEYVFAITGEPVTFRWTEPKNMTADHYNIYKFPNVDASGDKYHAFYDLGFRRDEIAPRDSFEVNDSVYYYYQMEPYDQVDAPELEYTDFWNEGDVFVVSAVDSHGIESAFSDNMIVQQVEPRAKDMLVFTYSGDVDNFVCLDTIRDFYNRVLDGYDYDLYNFKDSARWSECREQDGGCPDWHDFTRYKLVIIDDGVRDAALSKQWETATQGLFKYLLSGGKVAYFGALSTFNSLSIGTLADWYPAKSANDLPQFGIDSVFYVGVGHFATLGSPPYFDTAYAFCTAEGTRANIPDLSFDLLRQPFTSDLAVFWPSGTPPAVAAFTINDSAVVTHRYRSFCPISSVVEGEPVGLKTVFDGMETYLFGFHLWYMNPDEARNLIDWLMSGGSAPCCADPTGNVDRSLDNIPDIADLTALIWHLYVSMEPLACPEEANIDGDPDGIVDIGDLTALIDHLFLTFTPTAPCQ